MNKCSICPHKCNIDRNEKYGFCRAKNNVKIGLSTLHLYEEPCISGTNGSGTVFFSHCNLKCIYCQNYKISQQYCGKEITVDELSNIFIELQNKNAHNINLVTPTVYVEQIIKAIEIAWKKGLKVPIIYNSGGYENVDTIKKLKGYIDVYLPDFKYFDDDLAYKYSKIKNYTNTAKLAILEMYNQVGAPIFDENGIIKSGVIIRHLVLPGYIENSKKVLKWIKENVGEKVYISLMAQYFPTHKAKNDNVINRKLTKEEYEEIEQYLYELDLENGYIQELGEHEEEYVPDF